MLEIHGPRADATPEPSMGRETVIPPNTTYRDPSGPVDIERATPTSANSVLYMIQAAARPFNPDIIPPLARPTSFNDDLHIGPFRPSKLAWSGEQRRGIAMHVNDAASIEGHVMKAMFLEFFRAKDISLPREIETAMDQMISTPVSLQVGFRREQIDRVKKVVEDAAALHADWYSKTDSRIQPATQ